MRRAEKMGHSLSPALRAYQLRSEPESRIVALLALLAVAVVSFALLPQQALIPGHTGFLFAIGFIAIWRYSWGLMHFIRAWIYLKIAFPRLRRALNQSARRRPPLAVVVMSWRMPTEVNAVVYHALIRELAQYGAPTMLVISLSDPSDARILKAIINREKASGVTLEICLQDGTGKRPAMAEALHVLRQRGFPQHGAVALMDGDSYIRKNTFAKSVSVLFSNPKIGAVTTANEPLVAGNALTREWYRLRMAQRHIMMASMSLSERVLVLTGRYSLLRAEIALDTDFIATIENDSVHHARLGRIQMLTGEDKSTWRWTLARGWKSLYVPDVTIHPLEELPKGGFFPATAQLLLRWMGNMVRAGHRALPLGPRKCGLFPWWVLVDQRISIWTTLAGPTFFTLLAVLHDARFLSVYVLWILISRSYQAGMIAILTGKFHPWFIPLLYYGQLGGAIIKVFMLFHPYLQRWTRQNIGERTAWRFGSWVMMGTSILLLFIAVAWIGGLFQPLRPLDLSQFR